MNDTRTTRVRCMMPVPETAPVSPPMPLSPPPPDPPPFIASQRLFHLRPEDESAATLHPDVQREWLRPETFRMRRRKMQDDSDVEADFERQLPGGWAWHEVPDREAFLSDVNRRLLCLTVDAGCGKTIAMHQTQYLLNTRHSGHLAMLIDFARLPASVNLYIGPNAKAASDPAYPPRLVEHLQVSCDDARLAWRLLQRKARNRKLTLLVDALDQTGIDDPRTTAAVLADFLGKYPNVHCVVSTRPYALDRLWRPLFTEIGPWEFAQIDTFTEPEQKSFVGPVRHAKLQQLQADVLIVPRALEAARNIPVTELDTVRTAGDVYWHSLKHSLRKAFDQQDDQIFRWEGAKLHRRRALWLFALLGFETTQQRLFNGVPEGKPFDDFVRRVWRKRKKLLCKELDIKKDRKQFEMWLEILGRLNECIEFAALDHEGLTQIHWRSRTLQHFFAGLWVTCFGTSADHRWLARRVVRTSDDEWYETWRAAAEIPAEPRDDRQYVAAMSTLFGIVPGLAGAWAGLWRQWLGWLRLVRPPLVVPRSTEMIHRCWQPLQEIAAGCSDAAPLAKKTIDSFLGEFRAGVSGTWGRRAQHILCEFDEDWFVGLSRGKFWFGEDGDPAEPVPGFRMAKYQTTNALYALFDPKHASRFSRYRRHSRHQRCPAIYVTWYDAWCVATWLHARLPDEYEWECACRGQRWPEQGAPPRWKWCFGDNDDRLSDYAWYYDNSGSGTHPVGEKLPNAVGLYDMHGNVREWTASLHSAGSSGRVVRGGSWNNLGFDCRSARRSHRDPRSTRVNFGVRVARSL